jgi:hypothetical protein
MEDQVYIFTLEAKTHYHRNDRAKLTVKGQINFSSIAIKKEVL